MTRLPRLASVCALLLGASAAVPAAESGWWRAPTESRVQWRGMLATEGGAVASGGQMLYPGYGGVGGFLAAVLTHAALSNSQQLAVRKREQDTADRILEPYAAELSGWSAQDLWGDAMTAFAAASAAPGLGAPLSSPDVSIETAPVFTLAQDERVLIADVVVRLTPSDGAAVEQIVRVVSSPRGDDDARAYWAERGAANLKAAAASMLAHAVHVVLLSKQQPSAAAPARTHRYLQGGVERTERAQQVGGDCARALLRTLRGWLMSVPLKNPDDAPCDRRSPF